MEITMPRRLHYSLRGTLNTLDKVCARKCGALNSIAMPPVMYHTNIIIMRRICLAENRNANSRRSQTQAGHRLTATRPSSPGSSLPP